MVKVAIHQANFIPNFPFFYKMAMADIFVILKEVQFEKNNYQNRYLLNTKDRWVTKSVKHGLEPISKKQYADETNLLNLNMQWIYAIRDTLGIRTRIVYDFEFRPISKTERLIELIKHYNGDCYLTNPSAKDKYLDEELMKNRGIEIEYVNVPKHLQIHTFEAFEQFGIDGCVKQLEKAKNESKRYSYK